MTNNYIKLYVNTELREWGWGAGVNVNFDSPRLGGWQSGDNQDRSLQGMLASFRVWSVETDGSDSCPDASTTGLLVAYEFNNAAGKHNESQRFCKVFTKEMPIVHHHS